MADLPGTATIRQALSVYDPLRPIDELTDPGAVEFVATQLNDNTLNQNRAQGALFCRDLTACLQDIVVISVAQGAWTIEVHILDPYWQLLTRYGNKPAFFDVDDAGLLIPVDVNFPQNTDRWWRIACANPSVDPTVAHIYTFEDRVVTELRDQGGAKHASNNQTRAQFIYSCVRVVPESRFVCPALDQAAGKVGGDITQGQIAASAKQPDAPPARRNPLKLPAKSRNPDGAIWTKNGWVYTKPINGVSPKELNLLNPPTNVADGPPLPPGVSRTGAGQ